jgi:LL-diaminopimelate aminotransferase
VLPRVAEWLGAKMVTLQLRAENRFLPDWGELENAVRTNKPKLVLLNYPNNPTGGKADRAFLERIVELAHSNEFLIVQDAAYADFVFDGRFESPLQVAGGKEVTLELYSLSKSYNMQGYRLGFVAGSAPLIKAFSLVKDNTDNGQFIAIQKAGIHALDNCKDFLAANREKYRRRLERVAHILSEAGIAARPSPGTFYLYFPVPRSFKGHTFDTAQSFADYLIAKYGIISVPWEEAGACIRLSMTFEVGTRDFANEDEVFQALENRLLRGRLA